MMFRYRIVTVSVTNRPDFLPLIPLSPSFLPDCMQLSSPLTTHLDLSVVSCQLWLTETYSHISLHYTEMKIWESERLRGWEATQLDFNISFDFRALRSVMDCPTSPTYEGRLGGSHSHYCHSRSSTSSTSSSSSKCSMEVRGYGKITSPSPALNSTGSSVRHSSTSSTESNPARCYCREDPR